jgi:hypothetical protein
MPMALQPPLQLHIGVKLKDTLTKEPNADMGTFYRLTSENPLQLDKIARSNTLRCERNFWDM